MGLLQTLGGLAPTLGGVLGGIGGEIIDPFGGGVVGAGLGSALGRAAENATQGKSVLQGNDLTAGLEGAAGQGVGDAIGAGVGALGGILGRYGENALTKSAEDEAAQQTASATANETQQGILKQKLNTANYGAIPQKVQNLWKLGPNQQFAESMGYDSTNPFELQKVANAGYEYNDIVDNSLKNVNVNTSGVDNPFFNLVKQGKAASPESSALLRAFNNAKVPVDESGSMPAQLPASQIRELTQSLGSEIGDKDMEIEAIKSSNAPSPTEISELQQQRQDLSTLRDGLVERLNTNDEVNSNIANTSVSPEQQQQLAGKYGDQLASEIAGKVNGANSYSDIVPEMQRYAQMGKASDIATRDITNVTASPRANARVELGAKLGQPATVDTAANIPNEAAQHLTDAAGHVINGNKVRAVASLLQSAKAASPGTALRAGNVLSRLSPFTAGKGLNTGILNKVPGAIGSGLAASASGVQGLQGNDMQPTAEMQPGQPQNGMPPLVSSYDTMLGMMTLDPYLSSSLASPVAQLAPTVQRFTGAEQLLPQVQKAAQGVAGQGLVGGGVEALLGRIGIGPGAAYQREAANLQSLLQQLGMPSAVPGLTASPQAVPMQFGALSNALNSGPSLLAGVH